MWLNFIVTQWTTALPRTTLKRMKGAAAWHKDGPA